MGVICMRPLIKIIGVCGLGLFLLSCAPAAYQSGKVDQRLEGNGTVTKEDLREAKKLEDQRKSNQYMWDTLGAIIDAILLIRVY